MLPFPMSKAHWENTEFYCHFHISIHTQNNKKEKEKGFLSLLPLHCPMLKALSLLLPIAVYFLSAFLSEQEKENCRRAVSYPCLPSPWKPIKMSINSQHTSCTAAPPEWKITDSRKIEIFSMSFFRPTISKKILMRIYPHIFDKDHKQEHFPKDCSVSAPEITMRNGEREKPQKNQLSHRLQ